ncbi:hypothetical protein JCM16303_002808 [Sporobolomyces ruberrimus]
MTRSRASREQLRGTINYGSKLKNQKGDNKASTLNAFRPPPPTLPAQSKSPAKPPPKRTSRPSTSKAPPPPPRKQTKRILVTEEEQAEWDREAQVVEAQKKGAEADREGKRARVAVRNSRGNIDDDDDPATRPQPNLKPLTSFSRQPNLASSRLPNPKTATPLSEQPAIPNKPSRKEPFKSILKPPPLPPHPTRPKPPNQPSVSSLNVPESPRSGSTTTKPTIKPLTSRADQLFQATVLQPKTEPGRELLKKKKLTTMQAPSIVKLESGNDKRDGTTLLDDDEEELSFSSPEKKGGKKNYLPSGIAARASSILLASKTSHSLWLHDISRKLYSPTNSTGTTTSGIGRNKRELELSLEPDLKLIILEIMDPSSNQSEAGTGGGGGGTRGSSKTLFTRCRLDLSSPTSDSIDASSAEGTVDLDMTGLVLFSLHNHRAPTSSSSSMSFSFPQSRPNPFDATNPKEDENERGKKRTLFIPQGSLDFRVFREGSEVWVFSSGEGGGAGGGISEVGLNEDKESWKIETKRREDSTDEVKQEDRNKGRSLTEEATRKDEIDLDGKEVEREDVKVKWEVDRRKKEDIEREEEEKRKMEKKRERVKKGLVVTKFGVLV